MSQGFGGGGGEGAARDDVALEEQFIVGLKGKAPQQRGGFKFQGHACLQVICACMSRHSVV